MKDSQATESFLRSTLQGTNPVEIRNNRLTFRFRRLDLFLWLKSGGYRLGYPIRHVNLLWQ